MKKLVSKNLVHKKIYQNIKSKNDLPKMDVEQIGQLLIEDLEKKLKSGVLKLQFQEN